MKARWAVATVGLLAAFAWGPAALSQERLSLEATLKKARVDGKYRLLLRQIEVPADVTTYTAFRDYGTYPATNYAGYENIPAGYWVYVYPYWFIWGEQPGPGILKPFWGAGQATGAPDTQTPDDHRTTWASATPDGQDEWLLLEYAAPIVPEAVRVVATRNPGAVTKVSYFTLDDREEVVWTGKDPAKPEGNRHVSMIPCALDEKINRVKVYFNSRAVKGFNQIDAVGLDEARGKTHWAVAAAASSSWGDSTAATQKQLQDAEARALQLETELRQLRATIEALRKQVGESPR